MEVNAFWWSHSSPVLVKQMTDESSENACKCSSLYMTILMKSAFKIDPDDQNVSFKICLFTIIIIISSASIYMARSSLREKWETQTSFYCKFIVILSWILNSGLMKKQYPRWMESIVQTTIPVGWMFIHGVYRLDYPSIQIQMDARVPTTKRPASWPFTPRSKVISTSTSARCTRRFPPRHPPTRRLRDRGLRWDPEGAPCPGTLTGPTAIYGSCSCRGRVLIRTSSRPVVGPIPLPHPLRSAG